ncbi:MAG: hypothetical protein H0T42_14665 [Deltaproteobacteria bacterium]|nr:hypothetical protein [Deltaproteobacteria bacterium]
MGRVVVRRIALLLVLCAGCRVAKLALLPPINSPGSSSDPDRTRGLVETYEPPPWSRTESSPGRPPDDPVPVGPIAGATSASATLLFLLSGAAPLIGVYGTFEENDLAPAAP